jgi:hypothetical protein
MNEHSDIERVLTAWFDDGPSTMPDRVVDVVADRIERVGQRPAWRPDWRRYAMNTNVKIAAALAAVLVVAVLGYNLLPGGSTRVGGPAPSPSATPTATPTSTPVALPEGLLTGGRYRIRPLDASSSLSIVADIPAGWQAFDGVNLISPGETENTGILIAFTVTDGLFSDPCHWDLEGTGSSERGDVVVGPTVDNLVAALKANKSYPSSAATPITLGRFKGQELELQLPGDDVIRRCDNRPGQSTGDYYVFPGGYYALGPNSRWHLYIVDVDGTRLITMVSIAEGTPQADIAAAQAIVNSFEFAP